MENAVAGWKAKVGQKVIYRQRHQPSKHDGKVAVITECVLTQRVVQTYNLEFPDGHEEWALNEEITLVEQPKP